MDQAGFCQPGAKQVTRGVRGNNLDIVSMTDTTSWLQKLCFMQYIYGNTIDIPGARSLGIVAAR